VCDDIDNFARTQLPNGKTTGAVVRNDILGKVTSAEQPHMLEIIPDLRSQVQQWIDFEKKKRLMPSEGFKDEWTLFTVYFGVWDLWHISEMSKDMAEDAIERAILELFAQLDIIAENSNFPVKVVLPLVVDITLLPRYLNRSHDSKRGNFAEKQHRSVYLAYYWNFALSQAAMQWTGGQIFMPDTNQWLVDQIRYHQLWNRGIADVAGEGVQVPIFDEIRSPCTGEAESNPEPSTKGGRIASSATKVSRVCDTPSRHLFW
jgi:hypothetical protein